METTNPKHAMQHTEQPLEGIHAPQAPQKPPRTTVGFWEFFGLIALFAIPVIGFIACIIFLFAPKQRSIKNYAGAVLTWMVIRFVTAVLIVVLLITAIGNFILPTLNAEFGTQFQNVTEILDMVNGVTSGNYSKVIETLRPQLIETFGEEYAPLLEELSKEEYNDLFKQVIDEDYDTLVKDFKSGKYQDLADSIGEEKYTDLMSELEKASNGEYSEFFDGIKEKIPSFK